ncbi:hypothetical protein FACS189490_05480 [Clostridia bacterium]|nr:hypothetical protein FACS189490_05480 [Clostridia bacterium]
MPYEKEEYAARIKAASPFELLIINYELLQITIKDGNVDEARAFLNELILSLDKTSELAENLLPLYFYVNKLLSECTVKNDTDKLLEAEKIVSSLLSAWIKAGETEGVRANEVYENVYYGKQGIVDPPKLDSGDYKV